MGETYWANTSGRGGLMGAGLADSAAAETSVISPDDGMHSITSHSALLLDAVISAKDNGYLKCYKD
ncbi:hypothetical protein M513_05548 [Trichuris suis]|uniref:Uncharacterized protein n=1 Tax=Trichuris suis TaxID=68888 RepID=A0A085M8T6_9BILA|nr:hypothetical protein M513_05548 [Trichuris suis]